MSAHADMRFYILDTPDGDVLVTAMLPTGTVVPGPIQTLRVTGLFPVQPPPSPMSQDDFRTWRESLEEDGYAVDLSFME